MQLADLQRKRSLWLLLSVTVLVLLAVLRPMLMDRLEAQMNRLEPQALPVASDRASALHQQLTIVDLHADSLLWHRDLLKSSTVGHVDIPRLQQGNTALQFFTIVSKVPKDVNIHSNSAQSDAITAWTILQLWPPRTWTSLLARAEYQLQKLRRLSERSQGQLRLIGNRDELQDFLQARAEKPRLVGGIAGLEGGHALEGQLANLQRLHSLGLRMLGLVHFFDNELAGSAHGQRQAGLSEFGRAVIIEAEKLGIIIDLAHASEKAIEDVIAMSTAPLVVSHTGVKATCDNPRNLSDAQIQAIAATGGLIGIGYWPTAVCAPTPEAIARAIHHVANLVGVEHVGLGSDYDGVTTVPFDTSQQLVLTQALLDQGFSDADIHKISGGNALRVLSRTLPTQ